MWLLLSAWKLRSSQTGLLNITISSLHSNGIHSYQLSQSNRAALWCGWAGDSFIIVVLSMNQQRLEPAIIWAIVWPFSMEQNHECFQQLVEAEGSMASNPVLVTRVPNKVVYMFKIQLSNCLICTAHRWNAAHQITYFYRLTAGINLEIL